MLHLYFTQMDTPPADVYAQLTAKGWQVAHLPFRHTVFYDVSLEVLASDVIILTSKQAVRWLMARYPNCTNRLAVVGESSASLVPRQQLLFDEAPANAEELVCKLRQRLTTETTLLFLRGRKARDTISKALAPFGLRELVVYGTEKILENRSAPVKPAMVYFQAPGTVVDYMEAFQVPPERVGAIGPSTAEALQQVGWHVDFQPPRPENTHFAAALPAPDEWVTQIKPRIEQ